MVEHTVPKTNNLSAAAKNLASHIQRFAFFVNQCGHAPKKRSENEPLTS
jgi:hypothetical protein